MQDGIKFTRKMADGTTDQKREKWSSRKTYVLMK